MSASAGVVVYRVMRRLQRVVSEQDASCHDATSYTPNHVIEFIQTSAAIPGWIHSYLHTRVSELLVGLQWLPNSDNAPKILVTSRSEYL